MTCTLAPAMGPGTSSRDGLLDVVEVIVTNSGLGLLRHHLLQFLHNLGMLISNIVFLTRVFAQVVKTNNFVNGSSVLGNGAPVKVVLTTLSVVMAAVCMGQADGGVVLKTIVETGETFKQLPLLVTDCVLAKGGEGILVVVDGDKMTLGLLTMHEELALVNSVNTFVGLTTSKAHDCWVPISFVEEAMCDLALCLVLLHGAVEEAWDPM